MAEIYLTQEGLAELKKELDGSEVGVNNDEVMKKIFNEVQARLDIKNNIGINRLVKSRFKSLNKLMW